jgi:hypothetical protein
MSGGGGFYAGKTGGSRQSDLDNLNGMYGACWQTATKKTLEKELRDRGIGPRPWVRWIACGFVIGGLLAFLAIMFSIV